MLSLDHKRALDAEITKKFLGDAGNNRLTTQLAREFGGIIRRKIREKGLQEDKCHFYLKGGNAFSTLKGIPRTGDYDFQFAPDHGVYQKWENSFEVIDGIVMESLREAVNGLGQNDNFNDSCVTVKEIYKKVCNKYPAEESALEKLKIIKLVGREHALSSCQEINRIAQPVDDLLRVKDAKTEIISQEVGHGLHIYVNYTIPDFILYRLVRSFYHTLDGEPVALKSEMIDVSVPRPGSAECYLSQNGIITYFREKDGFVIPGWGYHFYENINLLQEVQSGCSGSPQKKGKRQQRLEESIGKLLESNGNMAANLLGETMLEDMEDETHTILGFGGVMCFPAGGSYIWETKMAEMLQKTLMAETERHLQTVAFSICGDSHNLGQVICDKVKVREEMKDSLCKALACLFVTYHATQSRDKNMIRAKDAIGAFERVMEEFLIEKKDYNLLTPLLELRGKDLFPSGFVAVEMDNKVLKSLICKRELPLADKKYANESSMILTIHATGGAFYAVLQPQNSKDKDTDDLNVRKRRNNIVKEMLERSILFFQRHMLEEQL